MYDDVMRWVYVRELDLPSLASYFLVACLVGTMVALITSRKSNG